MVELERLKHLYILLVNKFQGYEKLSNIITPSEFFPCQTSNCKAKSDKFDKPIITYLIEVP